MRINTDGAPNPPGTSDPTSILRITSSVAPGTSDPTSVVRITSSVAPTTGGGDTFLTSLGIARENAGEAADRPGGYNP